MSTTIAPNDPNLIYSPYNWKVNSTEARSINAGAYGRAFVNGTPTALTFDVTGTTYNIPQIVYRVDGGPLQRANVATSIALPTPAENSWGKHLVEWTIAGTTEQQDRWGAVETAVVFKGIVASDGATLSEWAVSPLNLLVYGDSITEGVRALTDNYPGGTDVANNAAHLGWAYALTDLLGAEVGVVGFGGQGWVQEGSGDVPGFGDAWNYLWSGQARSFATVPDVVVINQGTNAATPATTAQIRATLADIATTLPTTKVIVLRPFGGTQAAQISAAVAALANPNVTYVDTTGWWNSADSSDDAHPYGYANIAQLGPRTAAVVRARLEMSGDHYVRSSAGAAVPI